MINELHVADRREYCRIEFPNLPTAAISEKGNDLIICSQILDVSLGGARVSIDQAIEPGEQAVTVLIDGVRTIAEIVWRNKEQAGIRYFQRNGNAGVIIFEKLLSRELGRIPGSPV